MPNEITNIKAVSCGIRSLEYEIDPRDLRSKNLLTGIRRPRARAAIMMAITGLI